MRGFGSAGDVIDFAISKFVLRRPLIENIIKYTEGQNRMGKEFWY